MVTGSLSFQPRNRPTISYRSAAAAIFLIFNRDNSGNSSFVTLLKELTILNNKFSFRIRGVCVYTLPVGEKKFLITFDYQVNQRRMNETFLSIINLPVDKNVHLCRALVKGATNNSNGNFKIIIS